MLSDISVMAFGDSRAVHNPCESIKFLASSLESSSRQYAESEYQKV